MEKKTKVFIGKIKSIDEEKKTVEAIVSDATIDRYGEVILPAAFSKRLANYKKGNPVLLSSHNYGKLTNIIGKALNVKVTDEGLVAKFLYFTDDGNEEADWAWKLASKYKMAAFSVGFMSFEGVEGDWEKDAEAIRAHKKPRYTFTDVELLEVSQVCVPANPSAVMKSLEDGADDVDEITKSIVADYARSVINAMENDIKDVEDEQLKELIDQLVKDVTELKPLILDISQFVADLKQAKEDRIKAETEAKAKAEEEARIKAEEEAAAKALEEEEKAKKKPCDKCGKEDCDGTCEEKSFEAFSKYLEESKTRFVKMISTQSSDNE